MKKSKKISLKIVIILLIITTVFSFISFVNAEEVSNESLIEPRTVDEPVATTIEDSNTLDIDTEMQNAEENTSIFISKASVIIDYPIYGNAFIIGNNVTIKNAINGTAFIVANKVTFTESSESNTAFIMANSVSINGSIRDLFCLANKLNIDGKGYIYRDLYCSTKDFNLLGFISRDAHISSSSINIPGESLSIGGNLYYTSAKEANLLDSLVGGDIKFSKNSIFSLKYLKDILLSLINTIIYALVIILIVISVFKKFYDKILENLEIDLGQIIFYGITGLILVPIISLILLVTSIASLVGLELLAIYCILLSISPAITGLALGKLLYEKTNKNSKDKSIKKIVLISILITAVIRLLTEIPYLGIIIFIANIILGSGIVLYSIKNMKK